MPIDLETLSVDQLENLIENHRRKSATEAPLYLDALRQLEKRKGRGLDFEKSLSIILDAAKDSRFLSYTVAFSVIRISQMRAALIGVKSVTQSDRISGGW